jgi:cytochrome c553
VRPDKKSYVYYSADLTMGTSREQAPSPSVVITVNTCTSCHHTWTTRTIGRVPQVIYVYETLRCAACRKKAAG